MSNYVVKDAFTLPVDADAFSISPHARYIAKTMTMKAVLPDGREQIFLRIPDGDFAWQEQHSFKQRVRLLGARGWKPKSATTISPPTSQSYFAACAREWGPGSTDEMGGITLHVVPVLDADAEVLRDALGNHAADMVIDRALQRRRQKPMVNKPPGTL